MNRAPRRSALLAAVALSVAAATQAVAQEPALSASQSQGQKLFRSTCIHCHGANVWGTFTLERRLGAEHGVLEKRTNLVGAYVKAVVRNGVGSMPAYRRTELTDADVDAIVDYLTRANAKP